MRSVVLSSMIIGISMILQWVFFLMTGNVPELQTEPLSILFHLTIEGITAFSLIGSAILLHKRRPKASYLAVFAQGMLAYTVVNSAGYFAQSGDWSFVVFFAVLLFFSIDNTKRIIKGSA
jgi:hypothetical protein